MTAAQSYGISYCEFQLLFPDQVKPWSHSDPPGYLTSPLSTTYSISTSSSNRHLPERPVDSAPIRWPQHQPGNEKSSRITHTACTSSHTNTHPPDPDALLLEENRIKRARQLDKRALEFTRDYSLIKRHMRERESFCIRSGRQRVKLMSKFIRGKNDFLPLISFSFSGDEQLKPFVLVCLALHIGMLSV